MQFRTKLVAAAVVLVLAGSAAGLFYWRYATQPPPPSQEGTVSQHIGRAVITIEYSRPVARGRDLFGRLVPWGVVWNPGADQATTIDVSRAVRVNGQELPAGRYSLWVIPQQDSWTIIFSKTAKVWHDAYPDGQDALRLSVAPRPGPHMETLAFYFPVVDGEGGELDLHWGNVIVPLQITTS